MPGRARRASVALALLVAAVGCSDADGTAAPAPTTTTTTTQPEVVTTAAATEDVAEPAGWAQVATPPQCTCSDGSPYHFWVRRADPQRVVFFLEGGGACFSAATCGPTSPTFKRNLDGGGDAPAVGGIFDLDDVRNPFAGWSMVYVPYCTGDLHLGDTTQDYGDGVVVRHNGAVNAGTALTAAATAFPDAREVVVAGSSAGSAGAPLYAGLVRDLLPDAAVALVADGSGAYPDDGASTAAIGALWGVFGDLPDWSEGIGPPAAHWSLPRLLVQAARHVPDMRVATINYAYDDVQAAFSSLIGHRGDLLEAIATNNELIESEGIDLHAWIGPGTQHTVLGRDAFYTDEVDGTTLRDWIADVVAGEDVEDVRCTDCR